MRETWRQALTITAFAGLAVLAAAGWSRDRVPTVAAPMYQPIPAYVQTPGAEIDESPENCAEPIRAQISTVAWQPPVNRYRGYNRPRVVRDREYSREQYRRDDRYRDDDRYDGRYRRDRRDRSKAASVGIVAGSAGAGAAIGGLAGGGKGAAIGAVTGGVGGFIYDRLTHDKSRSR